LLITLIVPPRTRDFPRNLVIMVAAAANIAAGAIILPTYAGYDNTWCGGSDVTLVPALSLVSTDAFGFPTISFNIDESVLDFSSSLCTFQGKISRPVLLLCAFSLCRSCVRFPAFQSTLTIATLFKSIYLLINQFTLNRRNVAIWLFGCGVLVGDNSLQYVPRGICLPYFLCLR